MTTPPEAAIAEAIAAGRLSDCAKSQRGVSIFSRRTGIVFRGDWNGPPEGFSCSGSDTCKAHCRDVAVHAEERAIMRILSMADVPAPDLDLVHVKVVNGELVPSGPPSCLQCSRLIAEVGVGIWLFEGTGWCERPCNHCQYVVRWRGDVVDADDCPRCERRLSPISRVVYEYPAEWKRYEPEAFHRDTLNFHGLMRTRDTL